jgi:hypothetical protein
MSASAGPIHYARRPSFEPNAHLDLRDRPWDGWRNCLMIPICATGRFRPHRPGRRSANASSTRLWARLPSGTDDATLGASMSASSSATDEEKATPVIVALGFDPLVGRGLVQVLHEDRGLRIIGSDLDRAALEHIVVSQAPLAHLPTVAYAMRLLAAGASCLAKDVTAADILAAVHIAVNGRRVFPDVDGHLVERGYPATVASLTPRRLFAALAAERGLQVECQFGS